MAGTSGLTDQQRPEEPAPPRTAKARLEGSDPSRPVPTPAPALPAQRPITLLTFLQALLLEFIPECGVAGRDPAGRSGLAAMPVAGCTGRQSPESWRTRPPLAPPATSSAVHRGGPSQDSTRAACLLLPWGPHYAARYSRTTRRDGTRTAAESGGPLWFRGNGLLEFRQRLVAFHFPSLPAMTTD